MGNFVVHRSKGAAKDAQVAGDSAAECAPVGGGAECGRGRLAAGALTRSRIELVDPTKPVPGPVLYHYERYDCYECLGCGETLEVPYRAVLKNGQAPVSVKQHPENRLLWLELMTLDHAKCGEYRDAAKAEAARKFR